MAYLFVSLFLLDSGILSFMRVALTVGTLHCFGELLGLPGNAGVVLLVVSQGVLSTVKVEIAEATVVERALGLVLHRRRVI